MPKAGKARAAERPPCPLTGHSDDAMVSLECHVSRGRPFPGEYTSGPDDIAHSTTSRTGDSIQEWMSRAFSRTARRAP